MAGRTFKQDYTGRLVDLSIFQFEGERLSGDIELSFGDPVKIITGIEKVKQVFVTLFFSAEGSVLLDPSRGTFFGETVGTANVDPDELLHISNIAIAETVNRMIEDQIDSAVAIPDDEWLVDATLEDIQVDTADRSRTRIQVSLETRAGDVFEVFLPLSLAIT